MTITIEVTKENIDLVRKLIGDEATLKKLVIEEMQYEKAELQARVTKIDDEITKLSKVK
jgi:hypothetical protein